MHTEWTCLSPFYCFIQVTNEKRTDTQYTFSTNTKKKRQSRRRKKRGDQNATIRQTAQSKSCICHSLAVLSARVWLCRQCHRAVCTGVTGKGRGWGWKYTKAGDDLKKTKTKKHQAWNGAVRRKVQNADGPKCTRNKLWNYMSCRVCVASFV